jgi:serine/threonine-protein kinase
LFRERFIRESQIAASLDHPNIVPIFEADDVDGLLFIAMRYVQGTDLEALIAREGTLNPEHVISMVHQLAGALDAAHARGLVHRDVKPANVLIASSSGSGPVGHLYLSDFGVTKRTETAGRLTESGQFVGSVDYIAPEQIEGKTLDGRADIYSLGCVAFECLTAEPPFRREGEVAVIYAHLKAPRPRPPRDDRSSPAPWTGCSLGPWPSARRTGTRLPRSWPERSRSPSLRRPRRHDPFGLVPPVAACSLACSWWEGRSPHSSR